MEGVRAGSEEAVWELIEEFGPHIYRVIRRRLDRRMRSRFDSVDFVQMVWASFFRDPSQIGSFAGPDQLARYLCVITRNKLADAYRRRLKVHHRRVPSERPISEADERIDASGREATPSQIAEARECFSRLLRDCPSRDRRVVELRLRGESLADIGAALNVHPNTVRRVLDRVARLQQPPSAR